MPFSLFQSLSRPEARAMTHPFRADQVDEKPKEQSTVANLNTSAKAISRPIELIQLVLLDTQRQILWTGEVKIPACDNLMRLHLLAGQVIRQIGPVELPNLLKVASVEWILPDQQKLERLEETSLQVLARLWERVINDDENRLNWWKPVYE